MADRNIPRAEDIFSGRITGNMESRQPLFKKKKAPAPPSGAMPKIGSYQPKSLAAVTPGAPVQEHSQPLLGDKSSGEQYKAPKQYIIGDKDTPLKIEIVELEDQQPTAPPRRKRKAPEIELHQESENNNPLFGRQFSNESSDRNKDIQYNGRRGSIDISNVSTTGSTIDPDYYDEQGGEIDFGIEIEDDSSRYRNNNVNNSSQRKVEVEVHQNGNSDYPYIPPPDYDAEERTFNFDDEDEKPMFKEYAGEDFGKYLDDDEDYRINERQRRHGGPRHMHKGKPSSRQVQGKKYKKKFKQPEIDKRNTIRDFTFSDTKIGWGDRTVKSTSAKGRYIKREKDRQRIDTMEHLTRSKSQAGTYEDFLMGKHGGLDSPNSSDSGVDTGEDLVNRRGGAGQGELNRGYVSEGRLDRPASDIFYHSQPKQMRDSMDRDGHKASLWKRLTWRFKKSINISSVDHR